MKQPQSRARTTSDVIISSLAAYSIEFVQEAVYHVAFAAPAPAVLVVLAFTKARGMTRTILFATGLLLFVVLYIVSYGLFCVGCT
jgi:hypothetical protein